MTTKFVILPSAPSMIFEGVVVVLLFFILNVYIIYLASYDAEFKPNFGMLLNFLFENPTSLNSFKTYVKNVSMDEVSNRKTKESFSIIDEGNNISANIAFYLKRMFFKLFVKGNKISTVKTI
jgi:hypothetical protein